MKLRILILLCSMSFALMASAQASGGQIARKKPRDTTNTQKVPKPKVVKPEAVDLGLPSGTLWADRNVGADSPTAYGGLYRYGAPHTRLDGSNSEVSTLPNIVGTSFDIAMVNLGPEWRLPTKGQVQELLKYCQVTKEIINRIKVAKFVGPNGNYILLPLAGVMYNYGRSQAGDFGHYMIGEKECFFNVYILNDVEVTTYGSGDSGESVRAVKVAGTRNTNARSNDISNTSTQTSSSRAEREVASKIQPLYISSLPKYNIVAGSWSLLANAQDDCQKIRDRGYIANIYFESSTMYRVLIYSGTNSEQEAIRYRNIAIEKYPAAWIMCVENGRTYKYDK